MMVNAHQRNHSKSFLQKAEQYLASADDNLAMDRPTPAAGDAIHAGISAKDAIVTALTGTTNKGKDHTTATREFKRALGDRPEAPAAAKALRELLSAKTDVEYGADLVTQSKAEPLVRRARTLADLAVQIVRLGR